MRSAFTTLVFLCAAASLSPACGTDASKIGEGKKLIVHITNPASDLGTSKDPIEVSVASTAPKVFTIDITAETPDGKTDTSFNGFVNVSVQPGTIADLSATNRQLTNGELSGLQVPVFGAFGETHIWAQDLGYEPSSPSATPPPQCSDGVDNNNNGLIDYPADPGCYAPVDNTEDLGTYASGASEAIYYALPRIQLVRGFDPANAGVGNSTAFPQQQISIDTGWRGGTSYAFSTVVIGLTSAGFYVQDLQSDENPAVGYGGLYAYNYNTPPLMRVCDRVQILSGTSSDFYGFTELNYPAWQLEYWDPSARPCMVPSFTNLGTADLNSNNRMWQVEATLGQVQTFGTVSVHVAKDFGPGDVPVDNNNCYSGQSAPCYRPKPGYSNCDFNHTGKIDFNDPNESACATACAGSCSNAPLDYECSEYSQYASQNDFILIVEDSKDGSKARISANAAAAGEFDVAQAAEDSNKDNATFRSFTGLISYFSGGCQFTLNARCADDIIYCSPGGSCLQNYTEPLGPGNACVHPRSLADINTAQ
jgi:hypothetical protein